MLLKIDFKPIVIELINKCISSILLDLEFQKVGKSLLFSVLTHQERMKIPLRDYKSLFCVVVFVAFCNLVWVQNLLTFNLNNEEQISLTLENCIGSWVDRLFSEYLRVKWKNKNTFKRYIANKVLWDTKISQREQF